MKKTIFLFLLSIMAIINLSNEVVGKEAIFEIENYEIIVSDFDDERGSGFSVEKTGVNPFFATITSDSEHYNITDVKRFEEYFILYGYGFNEDRRTAYDSLIVVFDTEGNLVKKELRDFGDSETVKDIYFIDDILITYTEQTIDIGYNFEFSSNYFSSYDLDFNYIDSVEVGNKIRNIDINEFYILVGYESYQGYDIAIRSDLSFINKDEDIDIEEGTIFKSPFKIEFLNTATLNNNPIDNGITIDYPGEYILVHNNKIYNFTYESTITGVENNAIYNESVTPIINCGNVILNNDIYITETEINSPGNYELIVLGANNYTDEVFFTITSNLTGIMNNNVYSEPVTLNFNGEGYLNNQYIESPFDIEEEGEYILKINGENNYLETYFFAIEETDDSTSFIDFIQRVDILVLVVVLISGGIILKKK